MSDANLMLGLEHPDDAGVYRVTDELALILTVDFFTPMVDDPYAFGQIAVANALSDVYAMGGAPRLAMNIIGFPIGTMDVGILERILKGGADKIAEAGVLLVGGHSVDDPEPKYGLSVTGFVHPDRVLPSRGARAGDRLILTKPVGTGIISTAIKADMAEDHTTARIIRIMSTLNRAAAECMARYDVHACTDITGFGLLGHAAEMVEGGDVGMVIHAKAVPVFPEALEFAAMGLLPAGLYRNEQFRRAMIVNDGVDDDLIKVFCDPQTSGGLFISLPHEQAAHLLRDLHAEGVTEASIVGEIVDAPAGVITVRP